MKDLLSRRNVIGWSAAGALALPFVRSAAAAATPAPRPSLGKCAWTLVAPAGSDRKAFQDLVLRELAMTAGRKMAGTTMIAVTPQLLDAYSGASVTLGGAERPIDAILEITAAAYASVNEVNAYLMAACGHVQGWRVHPTLIRDSSTPVPLGAPSEFSQGMIFLQRLEGTTPQHFSHNWYVHAGHLDGQEAESAQSRAYAAERARTNPGMKYVQNRMLEAITPTQWVVHGYTQLTVKANIPGPTPRYERRNGEAIFEEWPPRTLQGHEYRLL